MITKMRRIGIVVEDIERIIRRFEGYGLRCSETFERKETGAKVAFFPVGDTLIEFINLSPDKRPGGPLDAVFRSPKGALNHLCFEVDDLEAGIRDFEKNGAKLVEGCPQPGAHGRIAFLYPETTEGILIELCEV